MDVYCSFNKEAYEIGMAIGLLCSKNICYVMPNIIASKDYVAKSAKYIVLGETADKQAICALPNKQEIIIDPLLHEQKSSIIFDDFSLQDAYRLGIMAALRITSLASVAQLID